MGNTELQLFCANTAVVYLSSRFCPGANACEDKRRAHGRPPRHCGSIKVSKVPYVHVGSPRSL